MKLLIVIMIVLVLLGFSGISGFADESKRFGKIADMEGKIEIIRAEGKKESGKVGMRVQEGDTIKTKAKSWAHVKFIGIEKSHVEIDPNSTVLISELVMDKRRGTQNTLLDVAMGKVLCKAEKLQETGSKFQVKTPTSIVGVRGTTFAVEVEGID